MGGRNDVIALSLFTVATGVLILLRSAWIYKNGRFSDWPIVTFTRENNPETIRFQIQLGIVSALMLFAFAIYLALQP
jgi:hypothetical protein